MGSRETIVQRVTELARPILDSMGLELVEVVYSGGGQRGLLRVFIDKREGVTLEDCARVSEYLGHALDVEDPIPVSYTLEVSSPGLDRPLKSREDFVRSLGKLVKVKTLEPIDRNRSFVGRLSAIEETGIQMALTNGRLVLIPFDKIASARLEVEF